VIEDGPQSGDGRGVSAPPDSAEPTPTDEAPPGLSESRRRRKDAAVRRRRRRRWLTALAVFLLIFTPVAYSWTTMMLKPSSLGMWPRTVEWIRQHHGNWLVDTVEHYYYSWTAPDPGGPQLKKLPTVGVRSERTEVARLTPVHRHRHQPPWPPRIKTVFARPLPGEGVWHGTGPTVDGRPPVLVTTFRTELDYPRIVAYVAWFDHTRTSLAFYPGRYEPPSAPVRGPMEIPQDQRWRLYATFNGGFIHVDTNNGSSINGSLYEPLTPGLATMLSYRDGRVDIQTWHGGPVAGPQVAFARQSLSLIIDHGRLSPALNDSSQWGYTLGNAVRVWRTGAGVDRRGNIIYAAADAQTVITLARILQRAGAVRAMELDINPEWPTLNTYTHHGGLDPVMVVPNYQQSVNRYLVPDDRDFFAVYRRLPGPFSVPFR
jgi:hypothetical protein